MEKALQGSILQYLQGLKISGKNEQDVAAAIEALTKAFELSLGAEAAAASVDVSLEKVFQAGLEKLNVSVADSGSSGSSSGGGKDPVESTTKFQKYLALVTQKGFFKGAEEGTPEYQTKYDNVLKKFKEKYGSEIAQESKNDEEEADRLKAEGNQHLLKGEYEQAEEYYTKAIEAAPTGASLHIYHCNRAASRTKIGKLEQALEDANISSSLKPDYAKAYARAAQAELELGRKDEARLSAEKALEIEPTNKIAQGILDSMGGATATGAAPGGMPGGMPDLSSLMGALGGAGGAGGAGAGGMPDMSGLMGMMNNPAIKQMMSDPAFMQQAQQMMQDPQAMASAQEMMKNMMGGGGAPK